MSAREIVESYLAKNFRIVYWSSIGDAKGPTDREWPFKPYPIESFKEHYRVGLLTGVEIAPGRFLHDIDIDWAPGSIIAQTFLPVTNFVFGRTSKRISHCFYTLPVALPSFKFSDIKDGSKSEPLSLLEIRGTKTDGTLGFQTMVPPSIWSKDNQTEPLTFIKADGPDHIQDVDDFQKRIRLAAVGMLLAKHLGINGFGHDTRLAWAGFLLRANVASEDLVRMGEAMSAVCNNREVADVRRAVDSTAAALLAGHKKVAGGPTLAKILGPRGKEVLARVNEWLGKATDFIRREGAIIAKSQENIRRAIDLLGYDLSYDEFADKPLINGKPFHDHEVDHIELQIDQEFHFQPPEMFFRKVFTNTAWNNRFHPVKQYLDGLLWDGVPRIDTWLITTAQAEDSDYTRAVSSIMLIAAARRVRKPGCKYDEMMVWESEQGGLKSSAAQALCPNPAWFSDDLQLNLKSQQLIEATLGKWIVEASDLAGKRKTELEQLKAMLSRQVDGPARMAYAHFPVERPRHFIIIGTTNSKAYLTDPTGARRFWPIQVQTFNVEWIKTNRDQLWAEAAHREATGESIRLHESLWPAAAEQQEERREIDPWEHVIVDLITNTQPNSNGIRRVTTSLLWETIGVLTERRDRAGSLRISDIMHRLGFVRSRVRPPGGAVEVGYIEQQRKVPSPDYDHQPLMDSLQIDKDEPPF